MAAREHYIHNEIISFDVSSMSDKDLPSNLWVWHVAAALAHVVSFSLLLTVTPPVQYPGQIGPRAYTFENNIDNTTQVTDALSAAWVDSTPLMGVQANEFLTFVSHVFGILVAWKPEGRKPVESWRRWSEYAVTAGVLECALLLSYGVRDFFALLLVFSLNAALQFTGGLALDQTRELGDEQFYATQKIVLLSQSFVFISVQIWYTMTTAIVGFAGIVWSSIAYALFYLSFGVLQTLSHTVEDFDKKYVTDVGFVVLSVTSKLCLSWHVASITKNVENQLLPNTVVGLHTAVIVLYILSASGIGTYFLWPCLCTDSKKLAPV